ncbi:MAG TPA: hypothetical protein PLJ60_11145 [Chryseolinea sp.]|nr:hypothetical protein [Chryseolinea sp.]HPM30878.1 hypothetical protein [Chryseolinea sp.]
MKHLTILVAFLLSTLIVLGQSEKGYLSNNKIIYTGFFSVGRSTFKSSLSAPSAFPTLELRMGAGISKSLGEIIELRSRLAFGVKFKREAYNKPGQSYVIGPPFMELDEVSSSRNHYFLEIPLVIQFNLPHPKLGFNIGANYRFFLPNNSDVDFLTNRSDLGIITGLTYRGFGRLEIGMDYYFGITKLYSSAGTIDTTEFELNTRNQFAQIRIEYALRKKK